MLYEIFDPFVTLIKQFDNMVEAAIFAFMDGSKQDVDNFLFIQCFTA